MVEVVPGTLVQMLHQQAVVLVVLVFRLLLLDRQQTPRVLAH